MSVTVPNYIEQGGARSVIGGELDIVVGGKLKIAGVDVTPALAGGVVVTRGVAALDGANPTPVVTGLTTIVAFVCSLVGSVAPGVGTSVLTSTIAGGTASVYAWKVTGTGDATLIASAGTESFSWVAIGV